MSSIVSVGGASLTLSHNSEMDDKLANLNLNVHTTKNKEFYDLYTVISPKHTSKPLCLYKSTE